MQTLERRMTGLRAIVEKQPLASAGSNPTVPTARSRSVERDLSQFCAEHLGSVAALPDIEKRLRALELDSGVVMSGGRKLRGTWTTVYDQKTGLPVMEKTNDDSEPQTKKQPHSEFVMMEGAVEAPPVLDATVEQRNEFLQSFTDAAAGDNDSRATCWKLLCGITRHGFRQRCFGGWDWSRCR